MKSEWVGTETGPGTVDDQSTRSLDLSGAHYAVIRKEKKQTVSEIPGRKNRGRRRLVYVAFAELSVCPFRSMYCQWRLTLQSRSIC